MQCTAGTPGVGGMQFEYHWTVRPYIHVLLHGNWVCWDMRRVNFLIWVRMKKFFVPKSQGYLGDWEETG